MNNIYKKNIKCARDNKPQIVQILKSASLLPSFDFTPAIMPQHHQIDQAKYIVEQQYEHNKESIEQHVFGFVFCLDYFIIRELIKKYTWYVKLFIIFPSADYLCTMMSRYDLTDLIKAPHFLPLAFNDMKDLAINIKHNLSIFDFQNNGLQFFEYQPYRIHFEETVRVASKQIREITYFATANTNTTLIWGYNILTNNIKNLSSFVKYPDVTVLRKIWEGKPIVCVAAGPSLSKNIEFLKTIKSEVFIIAVSGALKPLLDHGIKPDMITMLDMLEEVMLYLEGMDISDIYTVKDLSCFHGAANNQNTKLIHSTSANQITNFIHSFINKLGVTVDGQFIFQGTMTVANLSMLIANVMGASKIILLGQDLAYTDKTHVEGSRFSNPTTITEVNGEKIIEFKTFENEAPSSVRMVPVKGFWGDTVWTTDQFLTYREYMEHLIKLYKLDVVNATEGGSYIEGTEHVTLADAYKRYIKPNKVKSKDLKISPTREGYNFKALPTSIIEFEKVILEYTAIRDAAIEMVGVVEKETGENTLEKAKEYDKLVTDFLTKYSAQVDTLGQIGHSAQVLFRKIINANTSKYSDEDKMADSRNKVVLMSSAVIQTSGLLIHELELLVEELKTMSPKKALSTRSKK